MTTQTKVTIELTLPMLTAVATCLTTVSDLVERDLINGMTKNQGIAIGMLRDEIARQVALQGVEIKKRPL